MGLIDRAKNVTLTPGTEWDVIAAESTPTQALVTGYVLPLAAIAAFAGFIGSSLVGVGMGMFGSMRMPIGWGLAMMVYQVIMAVVMVFVLGLVIDALAPSFGGQKNPAQALKLAAYSYTPVWIAGVVTIIPMLAILVLLAAIYAIYVLYLGLPKLMKNPPEKSAGYTAVIVIVGIVLGIVISAIGSLVAMPSMMAATGGAGPAVIHDKSMEEFAKKMEEAGKKMEAAEKSGDPARQMEAAMATLGTALSGGKAVEPLTVERLRAFVPERIGGMARTDHRTERSGFAGFTIAKSEATYDAGSGRQVNLEISDTGGMAGLMGLVPWAAITTEVDDAEHSERTRREGKRVVREEVSKRGGENKYAVVVGDRFVVSADGEVDLDTLKAAVNAVDLAALEAIKAEPETSTPSAQ